MERYHLSNRQDVKNIKGKFGLSVERHYNDATSVRMMIEEMTHADSPNPILAFKFQGGKYEDFLKFQEEDFFLVFQHPLQKEMLEKYECQAFCLDSTHGTNPCNFKLITGLVVDEFGEGFPVAWCISNREDIIAIRKFLKTIERNLDQKLNAMFLMSDDTPAFFNAWTEVLGETTQ